MVTNPPFYNARQISGKNEEGNILSVIVKKSYIVADNGLCTPMETLSIIESPQFYSANNGLLEMDSDLLASKLLTDLVIKGKARFYRPTYQFEVTVQIGNNKISILAIGKRKSYLNSQKEIKFTSPELVSEIPLRYDFAYGGIDTESEKLNFPLPSEEILELIPKNLDIYANSLYRYQRNPCGKGFIVEKNEKSFENFELPNLEDPQDLLTPETLLVNDVNRWHEMPLPRCTDWVSHDWFPRIGYIDLLDVFKKKPKTLKEIQHGWANLDLDRESAFIPDIKPDILSKNKMNLRFMNGASLGLQLPYIKPGEKIKLTNIHPKHSEFVITLPNEYPSIWVDGRKGKLLPTKPVIHTVVIEPDENRLSIVWRGSAPSLRPYHEEELKTMPYKVEWNEK